MTTHSEKPVVSTEALKRALSPRSVAVVGASRKEGSVGEAIFRNLLKADYRGVIHPVNPKAASIGGVKCFASLSDIKDPVDLAIIIVPNTVVPEVLKECGRLKVPGAVVVSAGFKEIGGAGVELEEKVKKIARDNGIALIGPNCLGFINTDPEVRLNASFAQTMPKAGNIAFLSQSGALCTAVLDYARGAGIGFSKFISMGNKAAVNELDLLRALQDDPMTDVILMYVEDIADGSAFIELARQITGETKKPKPIIAIKSGRTEAGAKAASSHTGSLAGSDEIYDAVFIQSGIVRVETVDELFDTAVAFSQQPLPKGGRVAIITNAGGPGIMATDAAIRHGLTLAPLEENTMADLRKVLPETANVSNPIDVIGDARHERYEDALRIVLKDPNVDGVIVILTPQAMTDVRETGEVVVSAVRSMKDPKPVLTSFMGIFDVSAGVEVLDRAGIPHYKFPESAVRALARMHRYERRWLARPRTKVKTWKVDQPAARAVIDRARREKRTYLPGVEAMAIFEAYGLPILKSRVAKTEAEAARFAGEIGFPVVLKVVSPDIVHKFDAGGVVLNVKTAEAAADAYRRIMESAVKHAKRDRIWGVEVQEMAGPGVELFLGSKRDPKFGPVILFGLGGTFVEIVRDVSFRVAPLREWTIQAIIENSKAHRLLDGFRGQPPADKAATAECLGRLSQLVMDFPEIQELDINPLTVYADGKGARVVDGRIVINIE